MAVVLLDEFRGAASSHLSAHVPNIGSAWSISAGLTPELDGALLDTDSPWLYNGGLWVPNSGAVIGPAAATAAALAGADVHVSGQVIYPDGNPNSGVVGLVARWNGTTTWYEAIYDSDGDLVTVNKSVAGVVTNLLNIAGVALYGLNIPITLRVVGNQLTLTVSNDEQAPITDNSIAGAGKAGVVFRTNGAISLANTLRIQQFLATQL